MAPRELVRWQPLQEMSTLRNAMDRLFEDSFFRPLRRLEGMSPSVALDIYEQPDAYVVEAALAGVKPDDVDVSLHGNILTISGKISSAESEERNYLVKERLEGPFTRTITLPVEVEADKVDATFDQGVLRLNLPKATIHQAKRIPIKTGG